MRSGDRRVRSSQNGVDGRTHSLRLRITSDLYRRIFHSGIELRREGGADVNVHRFHTVGPDGTELSHRFLILLVILDPPPAPQAAHHKNSPLRFSGLSNSRDRTRTCDLRVMSPKSTLVALGIAKSNAIRGRGLRQPVLVAFRRWWLQLISRGRRFSHSCFS